MKLLLIIYFSLFFYISISSQDWNSIDTTDIPVTNVAGERIALFANHYGIHLLKSANTGALPHVRYFRLKTTGELDNGITSAGILLDDYGDFPNITGDENILYAVYRKGDSIKVQRSTNGGVSWALATFRTFSNGNVNCNGVDATYNSTYRLHVVWSEKVPDISWNKYESYFARFDGTIWQNFSTITNTAGVDSGGFPSVTTSSVNGVNRAHVSINTGSADIHSENSGRSYSRDFNYYSWSNPVGIIPAIQYLEWIGLLLLVRTFIVSIIVQMPSQNSYIGVN